MTYAITVGQNLHDHGAWEKKGPLRVSSPLVPQS